MSKIAKKNTNLTYASDDGISESPTRVQTPLHVSEAELSKRHIKSKTLPLQENKIPSTLKVNTEQKLITIESTYTLNFEEDLEEEDSCFNDNDEDDDEVVHLLKD